MSLPPSIAWSITTLSTPGGRPGGVGRLAEQHRRQRRERARPQHHRATGHQRRQRLPDVQVERKVVGRDRAHDADRLVHVHADGHVPGRRVAGRRDRVVLLLREPEIEVGNRRAWSSAAPTWIVVAFSYGAPASAITVSTRRSRRVGEVLGHPAHDRGALGRRASRSTRRRRSCAAPRRSPARSARSTRSRPPRSSASVAGFSTASTGPSPGTYFPSMNGRRGSTSATMIPPRSERATVSAPPTRTGVESR